MGRGLEKSRLTVTQISLGGRECEGSVSKLKSVRQSESSTIYAYIYVYDILDQFFSFPFFVLHPKLTIRKTGHIPIDRFRD